jgi:hypothetical protein
MGIINAHCEQGVERVSEKSEYAMLPAPAPCKNREERATPRLLTA